MAKMVRQIGVEDEPYEDRERDFNNAIKREDLTVIHFKADTFEGCPRVTELLKELVSDDAFKDVLIFETEAEEIEPLCKKYGVETVPTVLYFSRSKLLDRVDGFKPAEITHKMHRYCTEIIHQPGPVIVQHDSQGSDSTSSTAMAALEEKLKGLINQHKVMVFMKGSAETPQCGFSRKVVEMLNESNVEFGTFDILQDEEVRQGLKTYSDWQTYPQLYANGELVGGHDIIKELFRDGRLVEELQGEAAQ